MTPSDASERVAAAYDLHCRRLNVGDPQHGFPDYDLNLASLLPDPGARILDFGCGLGHFLLYLRARGFEHSAGIDTSSGQIARCRELGLDNAILVPDSKAFLDERPGRFDAIVALDVIEHIPREQIVGLLTSMRRALAPRGVLIARVPNIAAMIGPWVLYRDFTHQIMFDSESATQVLEIAGFSAIEVRAERIHYRRRLLGWAFERVRSLFYLWLRSIYFLQAPGSVRPSIFTGNIYVVGRRSDGDGDDADRVPAT